MKTTLSPIIAGTMNWGVWDKNISTTEMVHLMNVCIENKITTFDHADIYGGYTTETAFGKAFSESKISRDKMQLISKCGIQLVSENRNNTIKHYNYSKDYIIWSVDNSLRNLQTDYLDVLLLHRPSPLMMADEIAEAVEKMKSEGIDIFAANNRLHFLSIEKLKKILLAENLLKLGYTLDDLMDDGRLMTEDRGRPPARSLERGAWDGVEKR